MIHRTSRVFAFFQKIRKTCDICLKRTVGYMSYLVTTHNTQHTNPLFTYQFNVHKNQQINCPDDFNNSFVQSLHRKLKKTSTEPHLIQQTFSFKLNKSNREYAWVMLTAVAIIIITIYSFSILTTLIFSNKILTSKETWITYLETTIWCYVPTLQLIYRYLLYM